MIYLKNYFFLWVIKFANKFGRGYFLKKRIFKTQRILKLNFHENSKFNLIQVGANDGISFDFLYDFLLKRIAKGILIEPIKEYHQELMKNYKDYPLLLKINKAVHPTEKTVNAYKIDKLKAHKYPDWVKGIASLDKNHHKKLDINSEDIAIEEVEADTFMNIINQNYLYKSIDFMQIDTEGFDYNVIKMIDFNIVKPSIIKYEFVNLTSSDKNNLEMLLIQQKYYLFNEGGDTICLDLAKVKLF